MKTAILFLFVTVFALNTLAETRFVSKMGTSKPPYTSWATAADSIQKAINICKPGDTVYVGDGTYEEKLKMTKGIALIGSGIESCTLDISNVNDGTPPIVIVMADSCLISNFSFITIKYGTYGGEGIEMIKVNGCRVENNKFTKCQSPMIITSCEPTISNNIVSESAKGITVSDVSNQLSPIIKNNYIVKCARGIFMSWGSRTIIRNNIIYFDKNADSPGGIVGINNDSVTIQNNLMVSDGIGGGGIAISNLRPALITNNLIFGNFDYGIPLQNYNVIKNNVVWLFINKPLLGGIFMPYEKSDKYLCQYNNSFGIKNNYYGFAPDSTNKSVDPMFLNPDSMDFHFQMFSPMINAGDPNIKNVDGSRSDIGLFGGPYGESYTYKDIAPRPPVNIGLTKDELSVKINWNKNTEADFSHYKIYRSDNSGFPVNSSNYLKTIKDTFVIDKVAEKAYYKITAVDNQGNESKPGEETGYNLNEVNEKNSNVQEYKLYNNYPNPFNPTTIISYRLKERGWVKINIYDIKGEYITMLLNGEKEAGYHELEFNPSISGSLSSGVYIYRIDVKNDNNTPVFSSSNKLIYLK